MITVTGVTGKLGGIVLDDLRSRVPADQIVAVARTPEKVDAGRRGPPRRLRRPRLAARRLRRGRRAAARLLAGRHAGRAAAPARQRDHGGRRGGRRAASSTPARIHAKDGPAFLRDHGATEDLLAASGRAVHGAAQHLLRGGAGQPGPAGRRRGGRAARGRQGRAGQLRHPARPRARRLRRADRGRPRGRGARAARSAVDGGRARRDRHRGGGHAGGLPRGGLRGARPAAFVHDLIAEGLFREPSEDLAKLLGREPTSLRDAVGAVLRHLVRGGVSSARSACVARSSRLRILPLGFFGSASARTTYLGRL